ncbi:ribonuclease HIII [Mycoplasmopsis felis]|uniref:ribonuclease HIII n=1 Tax=Mycoplasmopsis felis TaxID=33923 RepID=UPI002AFEC8F1|nr:ribonuclease HIII [Mycoplasmopsis felis]WQQ07000.1 ribonuclease HIII [Mycoplasmopsis felis]
MNFYDNLLNVDYQNKNVLGIDETGVGDYFSPIISVCAFLPKEKEQWALELGVKDSKKLSKHQIIHIGKKLINTIPYTSYKLSQSGYNSLILKKFNSNEIKYLTHLNAIIKYKEKYHIENNNNQIILIDQYSTFNAIIKYKEKFEKMNFFQILSNSKVEVYFQHKAESIHLSVACASIIARYIFILEMEKQNKEWDFNFLWGANSKVKEQKEEFIKKFGEDSLFKICKMNFK